MYREKYKIASTDFVKSLTKRSQKNEDSQPADRVSLGFDAVLAQLQELVSTLSDRVERGEAVIDRIEEALESLGINLDQAEEESETAEAEGENAEEPAPEEGGEGGDMEQGGEDAGGEESGGEEGGEEQPYD